MSVPVTFLDIFINRSPLDLVVLIRLGVLHACILLGPQSLLLHVHDKHTNVSFISQICFVFQHILLSSDTRNNNLYFLSQPSVLVSSASF